MNRETENSQLDTRIFDGTIRDTEEISKVLRSQVFPQCREKMNSELLPFQSALYENDRIPTNQRNLADVRTPRRP